MLSFRSRQKTWARKIKRPLYKSKNHFQTNDSGKCYILHNGRLKKFYRHWSLAYINFYTLQKEAIVAEGNENSTELTGEHATLTQTLSLKSVVGKYV